jgi:hypothetical protein
MPIKSKFFTLKRVQPHSQAIGCTPDAEYSSDRKRLSD